MALGSDTGGSIRIPASYCGITGLKPAYGRVSRYGVLPLAFSLDHVGPLGSCVEDFAMAMNVIGGPERADPTCANIPASEFNLAALPDLKGLRVGVPNNFFFERVDEEVGAAVFRSVDEMAHQGAAVSEVRVPDLGQVNAAALIIQLSEVASLYAHYTDPAPFGSDVWALIQQGKMMPAHEYVNAQRVRRLLRRDFDAVWEAVDVLVTPTTPVAAPRSDETTVRIGAETENARMASTRLVRSINYLGEPALSMPCGQTSAGLPIGLQLISAPFTEPKLLQIAKTLESGR